MLDDYEEQLTIPCSSRLYEMQADQPYVCDLSRGHVGDHRMVFPGGRYVKWADMSMPRISVTHGSYR